MQLARLLLLAVLGVGLLFVLHEHAQNNRYQLNTSKPVIIDTRTGAAYRIADEAGITKPELLSGPIR